MTIPRQPTATATPIPAFTPVDRPLDTTAAPVLDVSDELLLEVVATVLGVAVPGKRSVSCQRTWILLARIAKPGAIVGGNSVVMVPVGPTDSACMLRSESG